MSTDAIAQPVERQNNSIVFTLGALWVSLLFFLFGAKWLWENRVGGLVDIDEAGYLTIAFVDYFALIKNGFIGWIGAVIAPSVQSPITTALASLVFATNGVSLVNGYVVPLACGAVTVFAAYKLTESISGPRAGLVACLLVATCPLIVIYSRSFHFAVPATMVTTLTLLAAMRSERFSNLNWSIAFGIFLGLLPLARTMAIAFMPGILLGALLYVASTRDDLARRFGNFVVAIAASVLTAATWLLFTWQYVADYLFSFGYGSRAVEFGQERAFFSIDTLRRAAQLIASGAFALHFVLICAGLFCGLILIFQERHGGLRALPRRILQSRLIVLTVTVVFGLIALVSSRNQGSAFVAPLLPLLISLAACLAWSVSRSRVYRMGVALAGVITAIVVALPFIGNVSLLPDRRATRLIPFMGTTPVSDSRGTIQLYLDNNSPRPSGRDPASASAWWKLVKHTNAAIATHGGPHPAIAQGFRHHIYNVNILALDRLITTGDRWPLFFIEPVVTGESAEGYRTWLTTGAAARANLLLTAPGDDGEFRPLVQTAALEEVARSLRFEPIESWPMPNGREVTFWKRSLP